MSFYAVEEAVEHEQGARLRGSEQAKRERERERERENVLAQRLNKLAVDIASLYLIRILSAIYSHSTDYSSYFAIFYRLLVNNLLLNSE